MWVLGADLGVLGDVLEHWSTLSGALLILASTVWCLEYGWTLCDVLLILASTVWCLEYGWTLCDALLYGGYRRVFWALLVLVGVFEY